MIACRSPLTGGELLVEGLNVETDERLIRSIIGIVPQENNLDPDLNVRENLLVYARYFRISADVAAQRSDELLEFVGLTKKINSKVDALSGGMKRRLIIARALLHEPSILLLDEPTTGLDPNVRQEIWDKLEELRRTKKLTIILSTHYMDEAEKLAQRLILMAHGEVVLEGAPLEIIERRVKKFALEVRGVESAQLLPAGAEIISQKRRNTHIYFAEKAESLTPLIERYGTSRIILRPSNLEDVFLQIID